MLSVPSFEPGPTVAPRRVTALLSTNLTVVANCLMGLLTCGLASIVTLLRSGIVYGMQWRTLAAELGGFQLAAVTLPHGIFELTGLWLAGAAGLSGHRVIRLLNKASRHDIRSFWYQTAVTAAIAVALTIIGAFCEAYNIRGL